MTPSDIATLFDHLYFVRDRVFEAAADPVVALVDPAAPTLRDLRATLVHELDVEWSWRTRLAAGDRTMFPPDDEELRPEDFADVASIAARWAEDETEMRAWLGTLDDAALNGPCRTESTEGEHPFWYHLQHLYSHAMQQFSDAAVLLTAAGRSPGELDFLEFVEARERRAGGAAQGLD